jgi:hypothetical protein
MREMLQIEMGMGVIFRVTIEATPGILIMGEITLVTVILVIKPIKGILAIKEILATKEILAIKVISEIETMLATTISGTIHRIKIVHPWLPWPK